MYIIRIKIQKKEGSEKEIIKKYNREFTEEEISKYIYKDYIFGEIKAIGFIDLKLKKIFVFHDENEKNVFEKLKIHKNFVEDISKNIYGAENLPLLVGWNIKNFDYPYLVSRFIKYYNVKINAFFKPNGKIIDLMNVFSLGGQSIFKLTEVLDFYNINYDQDKINSEDIIEQLKEELKSMFYLYKELIKI